MVITKKIAVILPVYNGIHFLEKAVKSVLEQSYNDFEFIIADDCSTDGSYEYLQTIRDTRIKLFRNIPNKGLFANLNFLLTQTTAPLIHLWSQDDIMKPMCLERTLLFHEKHTDLSFSYSMFDIIDADGKAKDVDAFKNDQTPEIVSSNLLIEISAFYSAIAGNIANVTLNRKYVEQVGFFDPKYKVSGDYDMWLRMGTLAPVGFLKERLIFLRNHTQQLSRKSTSSLFFLIEDSEIRDKAITLISDAKIQEMVRKKIKNEINVNFFHDALRQIYYRNLSVAWKMLVELNKRDKIVPLAYRWLKKRLV
jgi:glycosyltransferase involved in cell wall biosynthesis